MRATTLLLLWLFVSNPCEALVSRKPLVPANQPRWRRRNTPNGARFPIIDRDVPRGGATSVNGAARLSDYSGVARGLFGNMISPAAMLAGGLVPLGFLAAPLPGDEPINKKLRCLYYLLAVVSLTNELLAIIYATVASNKLAETAAAPAASVFELIKRDYELSWLATNVHFMVGLCGFLSMVTFRAYTIFPARLNAAGAGIAGTALLMAVSVVNRGVSRGDGRGHVFGGSILTLVARYLVLLARQLRASGGVVEISAVVLGVVSTALAVRAILSPEVQ